MGDWLLSRKSPNLACYLVPTLEYLGCGAYDVSRRRFSFTETTGLSESDTHVPTKPPATPLAAESFDGDSLAIEAGKMMARVAEEATTLALSPVQRFACSLSEFSNAEELRCRLGELSLPAKGDFVVYRFQTDVPGKFHAVFPESSVRSYKLSRKNEVTDDGVTLYVGSSRDFASRLLQHFGFGFEGTYALHLTRWVPESLRQTQIVLEYWTVRNCNQVRPIVLQTLEDYLWDHSRPVFGRRGSK
ncbi:hypothetical protein ABH945_002149 [Paraburkholderia sp. GAS333]|uniref:hypothetical protein n=1 Tax=Paraburkholderia sp. GAS333 TaxID=3156279 RepID=UPI003D1E6F24